MKQKGAEPVARQNFSMHVDLMQTIFDTTNNLNEGRGPAILRKRANRVTYSKVVAALVYLMKQDYLDDNGKPTRRLRALIEEFEQSDYERTDLPLSEATAPAEASPRPKPRPRKAASPAPEPAPSDDPPVADNLGAPRRTRTR